MAVMRIFVILKHVIYYLIAKHIDNCYSVTLLVNPVCLEGSVESDTCILNYGEWLLRDIFMTYIGCLCVCGITCFVVPSVFHLTLKLSLVASESCRSD